MAGVQMREKKSWRPGKWFVCSCVSSSCCAVLIALIIVAFGVELSNVNNNNIVSVPLLPRGTRLLNLSAAPPFLCSETMTLTAPNASLYYVKEPPSLLETGLYRTSDNFDVALLDFSYRFQFYLNAGSRINVSVCLNSFIISTEALVQLLPAEVTFQEYLSNRSCCENLPGFIARTSTCIFNQTQQLSYFVDQSNSYSVYVAATVTEAKMPTRGTIDINVEQVEYSVSDLASSMNCSSVLNNTCTLTNAGNIYKKALLVNNNNSKIITSMIGCSPNIGSFVAITLVPFILSLAVIIAMCGLFGYCCKVSCNKCGAWDLVRNEMYTSKKDENNYTEYVAFPSADPPPTPFVPTDDLPPAYAHLDPQTFNMAANYPPPDPQPVNGASNYLPPDSQALNFAPNYPPPDPQPVDGATNYPPPDP